jgi:hypothetical protein
MSEILTEKVVTKRIKPDGSGYTVANGFGDTLTSDPVDTAGYEGVRFILGLGAIAGTGAGTTYARQGQQSNMSDAADLAGSKKTFADGDDNKMISTEIWQPQERYVNHITTRATANIAIDFLLVQLFGTRRQPVTQDATMLAATILASPDEGTP